jgi:glycosyltransferase involved in cell wall biosynthesis
VQIAFLDSWLQSSSEGSGTAVGVSGLQQALYRRGHHITRIAPLHSWPRLVTLRRLLFNLYVPGLLRKLHYDLVIGVDFDGFLWARQHSSAPYLTSIKGVLAEEARQEHGTARQLLWSLSRLERTNAHHADAVLTTSNYCRAAIQQHYGVPMQRVRLVSEGINLARWKSACAGDECQRQDGLILCVSRQYPRKCVEDLLRALPLVRQSVPHARAVIVGDGPEHARLRQMAAAPELAGAVHLPGALPDDEVQRLYRQAAVFCLPSAQEGFGIVFLEAMASGLPIVATSVAAVPEVVPHRQVGVLVPPRDAVALAGALVELLHNRDQRSAYGSAGQMHVQQYDWDRVAARFLEQVTPFV